MDAIFLIAFITPALFYLGARARLTQAIHNRYPAWLAGFMNCAACAGAWYAMFAALVFHVGGWTIFGSTSWLTVPAAGLASIWWTPVAADLQERALVNLSTPWEVPATPVDALDVPTLRVQLESTAVEVRAVATHTDDEFIVRRLSQIAKDVAALAARL